MDQQIISIYRQALQDVCQISWSVSLGYDWLDAQIHAICDSHGIDYADFQSWRGIDLGLVL